MLGSCDGAEVRIESLGVADGASDGTTEGLSELRRS
jgi:hypothetical protein